MNDRKGKCERKRQKEEKSNRLYILRNKILNLHNHLVSLNLSHNKISHCITNKQNKSYGVKDFKHITFWLCTILFPSLIFLLRVK